MGIYKSQQRHTSTWYILSAVVLFIKTSQLTRRKGFVTVLLCTIKTKYIDIQLQICKLTLCIFVDLFVYASLYCPHRKGTLLYNNYTGLYTETENL